MFPPRKKFSRKRLRLIPGECNCLQLALLLGVDPKTVVNWMKRGLPAEQPYRNGQWVIRAEDVERFLVSTNRMSRAAN